MTRLQYQQDEIVVKVSSFKIQNLKGKFVYFIDLKEFMMSKTQMNLNKYLCLLVTAGISSACSESKYPEGDDQPQEEV